MKRKLGEILIAARVVSQADIDAALSDQHAGEPNRLGDLLVSLGRLTPGQLARALAEQYGLPFVELPAVPTEVLELVPLELQRAQRLVPFRIDGSSLFVAMADPSNGDVLDQLRDSVGLEIVPFVAAGDEIDAVHAAATGGAGELQAVAEAQETDLFSSFELPEEPVHPSSDSGLGDLFSDLNLEPAPSAPAVLPAPVKHIPSIAPAPTVPSAVPPQAWDFAAVLPPPIAPESAVTLLEATEALPELHGELEPLPELVEGFAELELADTLPTIQGAEMTAGDDAAFFANLEQPAVAAPSSHDETSFADLDEPAAPAPEPASDDAFYADLEQPTAPAPEPASDDAFFATLEQPAAPAPEPASDDAFFATLEQPAAPALEPASDDAFFATLEQPAAPALEPASDDAFFATLEQPAAPEPASDDAFFVNLEQPAPAPTASDDSFFVSLEQPDAPERVGAVTDLAADVSPDEPTRVALEPPPEAPAAVEVSFDDAPPEPLPYEMPIEEAVQPPADFAADFFASPLVETPAEALEQVTVELSDPLPVESAEPLPEEIPVALDMAEVSMTTEVDAPDVALTAETELPVALDTADVAVTMEAELPVELLAEPAARPVASSPSSLELLAIAPEVPVLPDREPPSELDLTVEAELAPEPSAPPPPPSLPSWLDAGPSAPTFARSPPAAPPPPLPIPAPAPPSLALAKAVVELVPGTWTGRLDDLPPSRLMLAVARALVLKGVLTEEEILSAAGKK
jgi:hypothetical protein